MTVLLRTLKIKLLTAESVTVLLSNFKMYAMPFL